MKLSITNCFVFSLFFSFSCFSVNSLSTELPTSLRAERAIAKVTPKLEKELANKAMSLGDPVFIRIFKKSRELEVWVKKADKFELFKTYNICYFSGGLGPKTRQGDRKSPEGFYFVGPENLNPWSSYHLSFNLGYPNAYDRAHGYTGSALMVHGKCVSIGCYAMTNKYIDEIYTLAYSALKEGQPFFRVHVFPFRMEKGSLSTHKRSRWYDFWTNLKQGYDYFEKFKTPPNVLVRNKRYVFEKSD